MIVRPRQGIRVLDPVLKNFIEPEGREVSIHDHYWNRRLRDGDVERVEPNAVVVKETTNAMDICDATIESVLSKKSKSREVPKE